MATIKKKNLEFISASKRKKLRAAEDNIKLAVILLIPLLISSAFIFQSVRNTSETKKMNAQIGEINTYLNSGEVTAMELELGGLRTGTAAMNKYSGNLDAVLGAVSSAIESDALPINQILAARQGSITVTNFSYEDGIVSFYAKTPSYPEVALYVQRLEDSGVFEAVICTGFSNEEENETDDYYFNVACKIK